MFVVFQLLFEFLLWSALLFCFPVRSYCVGGPAVDKVPARVSPFRLNFFFAYKRNKANLDPFHLCFTITL